MTEDYKGMFAELAELATNEHASFAVLALTKSDEFYDEYIRASERTSRWLVEHSRVINRLITERKYNQMFNEEVE